MPLAAITPPLRHDADLPFAITIAAMLILLIAMPTRLVCCFRRYYAVRRCCYRLLYR